MWELFPTIALKMIEVYSPFGIWNVFYIVLTLTKMKIPTTFALWSTGNTHKYRQIDAYIYQCEIRVWISQPK